MGSSKLLLVFTVLTVTLASKNSVPAIIWTNNDEHQFERLPLGKTVSNDDFFGHVKNSLSSPDNLLVFLKDKLSLEDLVNPGSFSNVKSMSANENSAHFASIAPVTNSLGSAFNRPVVHVSSEAEFSPNSEYLTIVHLPNVAESDSLIGSIVDKLNGAPYTAVFTGSETNEIPVDNESLFGRRLLSEENSNVVINATFLNATCVLLYAETIRIEVMSKENTLSSYELPIVVSQEYKGECKGNTTDITLNYENLTLPDGLENFKLKMQFKHEGSQWNLDEALLDFKSTNGTTIEVQDMSLGAPFVYAPRGFCYHCTRPIYLKAKSENSTKDANGEGVRASVVLHGLQIESSNSTILKFGRANDCIGFFTIPIWTGLITTLLLVSVLSFGVCMLASMNSIDRFDDPRGKTITVALGD